MPATYPGALAAVACLVVVAVPARADELTHKLERNLQGLKAVIDQRMESAVAVGDVTADPSLGASGGPAIANAMIDVLQDKYGIRVSRKARLSIRGRYKLSSEPSSGLTSLRIDLTLNDRVDERDVAELSIHVVDAALVSKIGGGTGDISGSTVKERNQKAGKALNDPTTKVDTRPGSGLANTQISAGPGIPYAVEVLVKGGGSGYLPRTAHVKEGQAFVPLALGEVYGVRLINDSSLAAGVDLAIDGLGMFAFADVEGDRSSTLVLPPRTEAVIVGWFRNNGPKGSNEFLVARASEAAAAKALPESSARIGMITATFSVAWPSRQPPPADEPRDTGRGDVGTVLGAQTDQKMTAVDYLVGRPRATVTVRYDKGAEPAALPPGR